MVWLGSVSVGTAKVLNTSKILFYQDVLRFGVNSITQRFK